ncbi:MAG: hypothetical protein FWD17_07255 [Polyangiaceae bacterium]|nr:hypothetical protein [Polyangiaceae bacterium]
MRRARADGLRARWGLGALYLLGALALLWQFWVLQHAGTALERARAVVACVAVGVLVGAASAAMQGTWSAQGDAPFDLLAALERRNAGRQRLLVVLRWCVGPFSVAEVALGARVWTTALAIGLVVVFDRRARALFDRDRRELVEARSILSDPEATEGPPGSV